MMKKCNNEAKNKPFYLPHRACYLTEDGKYYCYERWDEDAKRMVTQEIEVGKDLALDITLILDELDHDEDLKEYYARKARNRAFDHALETYQSKPNSEDSIDPWETVGSKGSSPEDMLFVAQEAENPQVAQVRAIINEKCTEEQKKFIADHFGKQMQLEQMRQAEAKVTGKLPSAPAMTQRKMKIIDKIAKALGVERTKRHRRSPRKD